MNESKPGVLFLAQDGQVQIIEDLIGKQFTSLAPHEKGILACCEDGLFLVGDVIQAVSAQKFLKISAGKNFFVAIDDENHLYSWGVDCLSGQLGQGLCRQSLVEPTMISHKAEFQYIASGEAFSLAVDKVGNIYAWGENFDRQLGLYSKKKSGMHIQNAIVEDMMFAPRLLPLSLTHPIEKVSCGSRFAMAISKSGKLFAWGAGECGQLGIGKRCTNCELPTLVEFSLESDSDDKEVDTVLEVACGFAHAIRLLSSGKLYSWGLNKSGQLGLGDTKTRFSPQLIRTANISKDGQLCPVTMSVDDLNCKMVSVAANSHSSAAVSESGELYTWGSTVSYRLIQPIDVKTVDVVPEEEVDESPEPPKQISHFLFPTLIRAEEAGLKETENEDTIQSAITLQRSKISSYTFSKNCAAAIVRTSIDKLHPNRGPRRNFSKLQIFGEGLWESPTIIVKFTSTTIKKGNENANEGQSLPVSRSCRGTLTSPGVITCKPPKFPETGTFVVSVSMDGQTFLPDTLLVSIYKEPFILQQRPPLLDARSPNIPKLTVQLRGITQDVAEDSKNSNFYVKMVFTPINNKTNPLPDFELVTEGRLEPDITNPPAVTYQTGAEGDQETSLTPQQQQLLVNYLIICEQVDWSEFQKIAETRLYEMRCQLSLNGQDFSVATSPTPHATTTQDAVAAAASSGLVPTLVHSFKPQTIVPSCYPLSQLLKLGDVVDDEKTPREAKGGALENDKVSDTSFERTIHVAGLSLVPAERLTGGLKGAKVEAWLFPSGSVIDVSNRDSPAVKLPVKSESASSLSFNMTVQALKKLYLNLSNSSSPSNDRNGLKFYTVQFVLVTSKVVIPLHSAENCKPVEFCVYPDVGLQIFPNSLFKDSEESIDVHLLPKYDDVGVVGFQFPVADAKVMVLSPSLAALAGDAEPPANLEQSNEDVDAAVSYATSAIPEIQTIDKSQIQTFFVRELHNTVMKRISLTPAQITKREGELLQELMGSVEEEEEKSALETMHNFVYVAMSLDGVSVPSKQYWAKIFMYGNLATYSQSPPPPKAGNKPGETIKLLLDQYCPCPKKCPLEIEADVNDEGFLACYIPEKKKQVTVDEEGNEVQIEEEEEEEFEDGSYPCFVRLRGVDPVEQAAVMVDAVMLEINEGSATTVSFVLPDAQSLHKLHPVVNGKEKKYYADISIDGGNYFHCAEVPKLVFKSK